MSSPETIRQLARSLLLRLLDVSQPGAKKGQKLGYEDFFPINVRRIATEAIGWKVRPIAEFDQRAKCDFDQKTIFINLTGTDPAESSFSLAHEIGHAVLHRKVVTCQGGALNRPLRSAFRAIHQPRPLKSSELESDADQFAAELLMPPKAVREHFRKLFGQDYLQVNLTHTILLTKLPLGASAYSTASAVATLRPVHTVPTLAEQFGVSRSAMARRLVHLRLVRT